MAEDLPAKLREEFNRPVPKEYSDLIEMSKTTELFFDCNDPLAMFLANRLAGNPEYQERFKKWVEGRDFIDLGCGFPDFPTIVQPAFKSVAELAKKLGARRYIGIDLLLGLEKNSRKEGDFDIVYLGDTEILEFLSSIPETSSTPKLMFFSGIESIFDERQYEFELNSDCEFDRLMAQKIKPQADYHESVYNELARASKKGDAVYLGDRVKSIRSESLEEKGFVYNNGFLVKQ